MEEYVEELLEKSMSPDFYEHGDVDADFWDSDDLIDECESL